ncbi:MAG: hypothetical protein M5U23_11460 [Acidimicrobiia bacterium]|nr:hypothetical protein [Acidimicrobiia bacterium]
MSANQPNDADRQVVSWSETRLQGLGRSFGAAFTSVFRGWGHGYGRLAESHAASVAGDALVAVALAGSLFFSVPSTEARSNVALYLLITLAPFAVIGPFLGRVYDRSPGSYRAGLAISALGRIGVCVGLVLTIDSFWLFPFAFLSLVLSRFHGISRASVLPVVVRNADELIDANARLARAGVIAGVMVVPIGAGLDAVFGATPVLIFAMAVYLVSAVSAVQLPSVARPSQPAKRRRRMQLSRRVRLARFATAGVRFLNGYLVLLIAFSLRDADSSFRSLAVLLGAAGLGYFLSAWAAPAIGSWVREEPMVVGALAVIAIAAFVGAQIDSVTAAAVLVAAAGFAWGTAKFAFDGLMHTTVLEQDRARVFTNAETIFQIAWVIGALIPVLPFWPRELGLSSAGVVALVIQVVYVSLVLIPHSDGRSQTSDVKSPARWTPSGPTQSGSRGQAPEPAESEAERPGVLDLL